MQTFSLTSSLLLNHNSHEAGPASAGAIVSLELKQSPQSGGLTAVTEQNDQRVCILSQDSNPEPVQHI